MQTPGLDQPMTIDLEKLPYQQQLHWWQLAIGTLATLRKTVKDEGGEERAHLATEKGLPVVAYGVGSDVEQTANFWFQYQVPGTFAERGWIRVDSDLGLLLVEVLEGEI